MSKFNDLKNIKIRLIDENKIEDLLSAIGCEHISEEQGGYLYTAQLPERFLSNNKRAVQIKLKTDDLFCSIRNRADFRGDIFNLISYIYFDKRGNDVQKDLHEAKKFICETFGWLEFLKGEKSGFIPRKDYTASLKAIIKGKKKRREIKPNPVLDESVMNQYYIKGQPISFQDWIDEGISIRTQEFYGVGFDLDSKRVVFPLRNRFGKLVGVKGRIMKDEDDERKYLYLHPCQNRFEWFNWHVAHEHILLNKKVYIFESEKSSMKAFEYGIYNALSVGASEISDEQIQMIKMLGLDIDVILCYDKGLDIQQIKDTALRFEGRNVYAIYDDDDLLQGKNAPIDEGFDKFKELLENNCYIINKK